MRESRSTPAGPRSRTLATFRELTDETIEKAQERAAKPPSADELREAALRAGAPIASPADRSRGARAPRQAGERRAAGPDAEAPAPRRARERGPRRPADRPDHGRFRQRQIGQRVGGGHPGRRGAALEDLLLLADALPLRRRAGHDRLPGPEISLTVDAPGPLSSQRPDPEAPPPREGRRDPPAARRRQGPPRDRRRPCPRLLRRAPRHRSTSTSTSSSRPTAGREVRRRPRPARGRRRRSTSPLSNATDRCGCGGDATPSTSSSPTTRFHEEMRRERPRGALRGGHASRSSPPSTSPSARRCSTAPRTGSTSSRCSSPPTPSTWRRSKAGWSGWSATTTPGSRSSRSSRPGCRWRPG